MSVFDNKLVSRIVYQYYELLAQYKDLSRQVYIIPLQEGAQVAFFSANATHSVGDLSLNVWTSR